MNLDFGSGAGAAGLGSLVVLGILWGVVVTVFYMVVAWRAMRAHEELAQTLWRYMSTSPRPGDAPGGGPSLR